MKKIIQNLIRLYQRAVSPFLGNACRFYPSCSEYAVTSIEKFGVFAGALRSLKRLVKCQPFSDGGYDPVES